ncbi:polysaccharide biosynthesis protein [Fredinandcohnia sp. QZ13]|uniref:putative polysaccharide biosynthesis protein n=1 Tax=Fredinandcohnia sp. QZ13 TaxID=3073144 RepID=UPI00285371F1|nr:polysaccharide biosynthesis protein [Fredinandcohnia sp. QZ13]MDR4888514.1 polysaccharide biosynthesis protein [Fredinandcohnia sp. QZ13]
MDVQSAERSKQIWEGAFILTLAGLITKILSAGYRIPYQNIAGDIGFYIYQQAYPIYGIVLVFSTYGFPVIISKLLAEKLEQQDEASVVKILYITLLTLLGMGIVLFSFLYWGADVVAGWMGDKELSSLIKVISFSFLLLPFISIFRGYFQGHKNMIPTAVSQVTEQLIRIVTILLMSFILLDYGYGVYEAGAGAIFGSVTGGVAAISVLLFYLLKRKKVDQKRLYKKASIHTMEIVKILFTQGMTICISALLLILFQLVDSFTVYSLLVSGGMDEEAAKQVKGIYDRGQPLLQLGTIVATSLALSLVPLIASAKARNDMAFIQKKVDLTFRLSVVVGLGAAVGLACVLEPTNIMLFRNDYGTNVLMVFGFSILFTTLSQSITAILQGLGHPFIPAIVIIGGMLLKWILNLLLIPTYETSGAAVATLFAFGVIAVIQMMIVKRKLPGVLGNWTFAYHVLFATGAMAFVIFCYSWVLHHLFPVLGETRTFASFEALSSVFIGGLTYLFFILRGSVFTKVELSEIPIGSKGTFFIRLLKGGKRI